MTHSTLQAVEQPSPESTDPLHDLIRRGARQLIATAVNAELGSMLKSYAHQRDGQGRRAVVRNGYLPEDKPGRINLDIHHLERRNRS